MRPDARCGSGSTKLRVSTTSPLNPPIADIGADIVLRRFVPQADSCAVARCPHSITSSARARNVGGTSRPSASAVLRLVVRKLFTLLPRTRHTVLHDRIALFHSDCHATQGTGLPIKARLLPACR